MLGNETRHMLGKERDCSQSTQKLGLKKNLTQAENVAKCKCCQDALKNGKLSPPFNNIQPFVMLRVSLLLLEAKFNRFKRSHVWVVIGRFSFFYQVLAIIDSSNKSILSWVFKTQIVLLKGTLKEYPLQI